MAEPYPPGSWVRVRLNDPPVHTRCPRYVRGRTGRVVAVHGCHRLPDDVLRGADPPAVTPVYSVRFEAADLWGEGDHSVIVDLWEPYLDRPEEKGP
jgi:hypothetical protein